MCDLSQVFFARSCSRRPSSRSRSSANLDCFTPLLTGVVPSAFGGDDDDASIDGGLFSGEPSTTTVEFAAAMLRNLLPKLFNFDPAMSVSFSILLVSERSETLGELASM